jgi:hypothetical protein
MRHSVSVSLFLVLASVLPSRAFAQEPLWFGVKGGLNLASADVTAIGFSISPDSRPGVVVGAFVGYDFHPNFGMQVEGLYTQKGAKVNEFGLDLDVRLDYIEIPMLARANVRAAEATMIHFTAGPAFAFTLSQTLDLEDLIGFGFDDLETKGWDAGIAFGGGVTFRNLVFDARYTFGLVNINDERVEDLLQVKNRAFSVTAGWRFGSFGR